MNAVTRMNAQHAQPAITYRAWRIGTATNPHKEATPIDLPVTVSSVEQAAQAACLHRGEMIHVLKSDSAQRPERRHELHIFQTKRSTKARREWCPDRDRFVPLPAEYPAPVGIVCVGEGYSPVEPWKTEDGNALGVDLTLVEQ